MQSRPAHTSKPRPVECHERFLAFLEDIEMSSKSDKYLHMYEKLGVLVSGKNRNSAGGSRVQQPKMASQARSESAVVLFGV